jgi:hypothetical protein
LTCSGGKHAAIDASKAPVEGEAAIETAHAHAPAAKAAKVTAAETTHMAAAKTTATAMAAAKCRGRPARG